jgi:hypothetical protein
MRETIDEDGRIWLAEIVSHGRTSGYLNPKVHRPLVQFSCKDGSLPRRYASLPRKAESLEQLNDGELAKLLTTAKSH